MLSTITVCLFLKDEAILHLVYATPTRCTYNRLKYEERQNQACTGGECAFTDVMGR